MGLHDAGLRPGVGKAWAQGHGRGRNCPTQAFRHASTKRWPPGRGSGGGFSTQAEHGLPERGWAWNCQKQASGQAAAKLGPPGSIRDEYGESWSRTGAAPALRPAVPPKVSPLCSLALSGAVVTHSCFPRVPRSLLAFGAPSGPSLTPWKGPPARQVVLWRRKAGAMRQEFGLGGARRRHSATRQQSLGRQDADGPGISRRRRGATIFDKAWTSSARLGLELPKSLARRGATGPGIAPRRR